MGTKIAKNRGSFEFVVYGLLFCNLKFVQNKCTRNDHKKMGKVEAQNYKPQTHSPLRPLIAAFFHCWFNSSNSFSSASLKFLLLRFFKSGWPAFTHEVCQKHATAKSVCVRNIFRFANKKIPLLVS